MQQQGIAAGQQQPDMPGQALAIAFFMQQQQQQLAAMRPVAGHSKVAAPLAQPGATANSFAQSPQLWLLTASLQCMETQTRSHSLANSLLLFVWYCHCQLSHWAFGNSYVSKLQGPRSLWQLVEAALSLTS